MKINKNNVKNSKKQKHESKVSEWLEDDDVHYKEELKNVWKLKLT